MFFQALGIRFCRGWHCDLGLPSNSLNTTITDNTIISNSVVFSGAVTHGIQRLSSWRITGNPEVMRALVRRSVASGLRQLGLDGRGTGTLTLEENWLQLAFRTSTAEYRRRKSYSRALECRNFFNYHSLRRIFELSTAS